MDEQDEPQQYRDTREDARDRLLLAMASVVVSLAAGSNNVNVRQQDQLVMAMAEMQTEVHEQ